MAPFPGAERNKFIKLRPDRPGIAVGQWHEVLLGMFHKDSVSLPLGTKTMTFEADIAPTIGCSNRITLSTGQWALLSQSLDTVQMEQGGPGPHPSEHKKGWAP